MVAMFSIDLEEAKARLPQLVELIKSGAETEIVITENGVPVARLVPMPNQGIEKLRSDGPIKPDLT